ncbi:MAG: helix-turn-helix domain-containing protein [Coriobacteriia bacterium]|nr:helix-turn-helix domain-containing protein [Coriobacteriia bacterium]MCL2537158.1 helix-turn-helix domain-containing protein [Coriobacteriia bacterium]
MSSLGDMLIEARRSAGLTAQDVSQRTHIMQSAIDNLENDNLDAVPASGYARGYILSYCKICGVDPASFLAQFDRQSQGSRREPATRPSYNPSLAPLPRKSEHEMNWRVIAVVVVVIAVIAGGIYFMNRDSGFVPGTNPLPAEATPTVSTTPEAQVPEDQRVPFSFTVEAREGRASVVQVLVDGNIAFDGSITSGTDSNSETFDGAHEARVEIASPENVIVMQGTESIPIPDDGILYLTATDN